MHKELTNLLPQERQDKIAREQRFRFGVVVVMAGSFLCLSAGMLLVPTYVFLTGSARTKEARLAELKSVLSSEEEKALATRLDVLSNDASVLVALSKATSASGVLRTVLEVPRPGVTLSEFVYTPKTSKVLGVLAVSGVAVTREALRRYQLALQGASFVRTASLPVSAYAQDTDIHFTITITLAP